MNVKLAPPSGWQTPQINRIPDQFGRRRRDIELLPSRSQVFLAAAWARYCLPIFERDFPDDQRPRAAIGWAELYATKKPRAGIDELPFGSVDDVVSRAFSVASEIQYKFASAEASRAAAYAAYTANSVFNGPEYMSTGGAAAHVAYYTARSIVLAKFGEFVEFSDISKSDPVWQWLYATYCHARGPSFAFNREWRTSTACAIAAGILKSKDFTAMPILADALQEAGLEDEGVLQHLREDFEEFTLADWVLINLYEGFQ